MKVQIGCLLFLWFAVRAVSGSRAAQRLFDDILSGYQKLARPVAKDFQIVTVFLQLRLSQIIDVHEKDQMIITNMWLRQEWYDAKLRWDPEDYEGTKYLYVPAEMIWLPDIVLYNNADGNYQVTIMTKATLHYSGLVVWEPPAIWKSMCHMNLQWFPFDEQECLMKFGAWSYDGYQVDLIHWRNSDVNVSLDDDGQKVWEVQEAIDLTEYYPNVEWDILGVPGRRHALMYPCCSAPFIDITYYLHIRRKTLFYTVNLIVPCVGLSFLTLTIFYLPADSGEKIALCISVLIALTVFYLLLVEMIPASSLVIPLIGKYLLFTMLLVSLSVTITVMTLNIHYRSGFNYAAMPQWVRRWFLHKIPRLLFMQESHVQTWSHGQIYVPLASCPTITSKPPQQIPANSVAPVETGKNTEMEDLKETSKRESVSSLPNLREQLEGNQLYVERKAVSDGTVKRQKPPPILPRDKLLKVAQCLDYIALKVQREEHETEIMHEWKYVAMVLDRLFLGIFGLVCLLGTIVILFQAPALHDPRKPISHPISLLSDD